MRSTDLLDEILHKEKEIDALLEQVMEKERRKEAEEQKVNEQKQRLLAGTGSDDNDLPIVEESLKATDVATAPTESAPHGSQSNADKKKKRNRLVRMLHALRRRLGRR